jgi:hypothetical protein
LSENEVKAAYLFNFARFTDWPAAALNDAHFTLCMTGAGDPFDGALARIDAKPLHGRVSRVRYQVAAADVRDCHLLFVPASELAQWGALRAQLRSAPVLTVSDAGDFIDRGGMAALQPQGRRLGFAIHLGAARAAGLRPQAQLLKLALEVRE